MQDLISRQAAIDAIHCDITITGRQNAELVATTIGAFADRIKALPPALSEEDCETCKHGYFGDTYCNNCRVRFPSHYERRTDGRFNQQAGGD